MLRYSSPNTTGVLNKSECGNLFEICLVKKRNCRSDFLCLLVEKKCSREQLPKNNFFLFGTLQYVKKSIKKVLSIHLHLHKTRYSQML